MTIESGVAMVTARYHGDGEDDRERAALTTPSWEDLKIKVVYV